MPGCFRRGRELFFLLRRPCGSVFFCLPFFFFCIVCIQEFDRVTALEAAIDKVISPVEIHDFQLVIRSDPTSLATAATTAVDRLLAIAWKGIFTVMHEGSIIIDEFESMVAWQLIKVMAWRRGNVSQENINVPVPVASRLLMFHPRNVQELMLNNSLASTTSSNVHLGCEVRIIANMRPAATAIGLYIQMTRVGRVGFWEEQ